MSPTGSKPGPTTTVLDCAERWPRRPPAPGRSRSAELLRLVGADARLPAPCANPILRDEQGRRLTTPDVWFDNVALAVMVHSRTYHAGVLDWEATVASDEDLREAGAEVVTVTPTAIVGDPARVTERVVKAYARASRRPRPPGLVAEPRQPPWEIAKRLA